MLGEATSNISLEDLRRDFENNDVSLTPEAARGASRNLGGGRTSTTTRSCGLLGRFATPSARCWASRAPKRKYRRLRSLTAGVEVRPPLHTEELAYLAAGERVIDLSNVVVAVWDGRARPGSGAGATPCNMR